GGVKALGEPAIDWCQQLAGLDVLALLLPQARQAHGGAQFQRCRLLTAGHLEGPQEVHFSTLPRRPLRLPPSPLPSPAMQFSFPPAFPGPLHRSTSLGQELVSCAALLSPPLSLSQQGTVVRPSDDRPRREQVSETLTELCQSVPIGPLGALCRERPAPQ